MIFIKNKAKNNKRIFQKQIQFEHFTSLDKFWTFLRPYQSILAQTQHPGPFLETREQELSFGTKINGIFCFIVGDISF